jgi:acyl-CoA reductase-like NAD-dependent aldehyde dehydrogenase
VPALADLRVGDGLVDGVQVGPLVSRSAKDEVDTAVSAPLAEGAELLAGGPGERVPDRGWFVRPTRLATDKPTITIACDEVFGPVSVVLPFASVDEGFRLANDTRYGLSAAVFTGSERLARRVADELAAGLVNACASQNRHVTGGTRRDDRRRRASCGGSRHGGRADPGASARRPCR